MSRLDSLRLVAREKEIEIARLQAELVAARAFLRSLRASMHALEQENAAQRSPRELPDPVVRVRALIHEAGRPLYIDEILRGLGRPVSRDAREEVRSLLRPWVRRGEIFTRPRPSTFGLVELRRPSVRAAGAGKSV